MITPPTSARTTRMIRPSMISWRPVDHGPRRQRKHGAVGSSKEIHESGTQGMSSSTTLSAGSYLT
jgi:hypothetical protein